MKTLALAFAAVVLFSLTALGAETEKERLERCFAIEQKMIALVDVTAKSVAITYQIAGFYAQVQPERMAVLVRLTKAPFVASVVTETHFPEQYRIYMEILKEMNCGE